jgi:hypothetical protein
MPVLVAALSDSEPLVRGHAAWALGEIASPLASAVLIDRLDVEDDPWVRDEMALALARFNGRSSSRDQGRDGRLRERDLRDHQTALQPLPPAAHRRARVTQRRCDGHTRHLQREVTTRTTGGSGSPDAADGE